MKGYIVPIHLNFDHAIGHHGMVAMSSRFFPDFKD
jgi:hypothetical protein